MRRKEGCGSKQREEQTRTRTNETLLGEDATMTRVRFRSDGLLEYEWLDVEYEGQFGCQIVGSG